MHDNCDSCGKDYDFDKSRDVLVLYLTDMRCNHVLATCPYCSNETQIFLVPEGVMMVLELHLRLRMGLEATNELSEQAMALWGQPDRQGGDVWPFRRDSGGNDDDAPALPELQPLEPPRDWLMHLYDDLRHFDHDCGGCNP